MNLKKGYYQADENGVSYYGEIMLDDVNIMTAHDFYKELGTVTDETIYTFIDESEAEVFHYIHEEYGIYE